MVLTGAACLYGPDEAADGLACRVQTLTAARDFEREAPSASPWEGLP
jgi:hypothetical protein